MAYAKVFTPILFCVLMYLLRLCKIEERLPFIVLNKDSINGLSYGNLEVK